MPEITINGKEYVLSEGITVIGRDDAADIAVDSKKLSRTHARFTVQGNDLFIEDLGSKNGTFVNGRRIEGRTAYQRGDQVRLGDIEVTVRSAGGAAPAPAAASAPAASPAVKSTRDARLEGMRRTRRMGLIKKGAAALILLIVGLMVYSNFDAWFMPRAQKDTRVRLAEITQRLEGMTPDPALLDELQQMQAFLAGIPVEYKEEQAAGGRLSVRVDELITAIEKVQAAQAAAEAVQQAFDTILVQHASGAVDAQGTITALQAFQQAHPASSQAALVPARIAELNAKINAGWDVRIAQAEADVKNLFEQKQFRAARAALAGYLQNSLAGDIPELFSRRAGKLKAMDEQIVRAAAEEFETAVRRELRSAENGDPQTARQAITAAFETVGLEENRPAYEKALAAVDAIITRRLEVFKADMDKAEELFRQRAFARAGAVYESLITRAGADRGMAEAFKRQQMRCALFAAALNDMIAFTRNAGTEIAVEGLGAITTVTETGFDVVMEGQRTTFPLKNLGDSNLYSLFVAFSMQCSGAALDAVCGLMAFESGNTLVAEKFLSKALQADPSLRTVYALLLDGILASIAEREKERREEDARRAAELAQRREEMKKEAQKPQAAVGAQVWPALISGTPGVVPPWPTPKGGQRVANISSLESALGGAGKDRVIFLADGDYYVRDFLPIRNPVTICGESKDPTKVRIHGDGFENGNVKDALHIYADDVTIAHITVMDCRWNGIIMSGDQAPKRTQIYNCNFYNISERAFKGSSYLPDGPYPEDGFIKYCFFKNDKIPLASHYDKGNYVTAIDCMAIHNWTISDNVFMNMRGRDGLGRAAIFLWQGIRDVTVERNLIINCDRGIAFGNGQPPTDKADMRGPNGLHHASGGIIRNNVVYREAGYSLEGIKGDTGIEFVFAENFKCYHNTVFLADRPACGHIEYRFDVTTGEIFNNLSSGQIQNRGAGKVTVSNNGTLNLDTIFVNPKEYDFHIAPGKSAPGASRELEAGLCDHDMDGQLRPPKGTPGADQQ